MLIDNQMETNVMFQSSQEVRVESKLSNSTNDDTTRKTFCQQFSSRFCRFSNNSERFELIVYYMRVFLTHLFSTTGLCFLVVAYSGLGAVIFTHLESNNELKIKSSFESDRIKTALDLWNYTLQMNVLYPELWFELTVERIGKFEQRIADIILNEGYATMNSEQWSFSGALLYSVTVITTIGYGNVTCKTNWGRIATILYAIVGIPITFLCLANLGYLMAQAFRFSYRRMCRCDCAARSNQPKIIQNELCKQLDSHSRKGEFLYMNKNEKVNSTISDKLMRHNSLAIMQRDHECKGENERSFVRRTQSTNNGSKPKNAKTSEMTAVMIDPLDENSIQNETTPSMFNGIDLMADWNIDTMDQAVLDAIEDKERVPISLVFLLVLFYIILGSFMFSIWEGWSPIEGAYFCFTTLTTIGFGDLVPGSAKLSYNKDGQTKFIICCAYMMVGLALIAMSFNLVQEEIVIKCRRIARRMGIMPTNVKHIKIVANNREQIKTVSTPNDGIREKPTEI